jgi:hypothetical protein
MMRLFFQIFGADGERINGGRRPVPSDTVFRSNAEMAKAKHDLGEDGFSLEIKLCRLP